MQAGVLGKSAGELDSKLAGGSGVPGSPFPSPAVAGLAVESSLVRDTEAQNTFTSACRTLLCWGKAGVTV